MPITVQGLQQAQRDNLKMIRALAPNTGLGRAVQVAAIDLQRYTVAITHVDTGTLRAAHRIEMQMSGNAAQATIYVDPTAVNPRSNKRAEEYSVVEHARGEGHAFYERTYNERGDRAVDLGIRALEAEL